MRIVYAFRVFLAGYGINDFSCVLALQEKNVKNRKDK